MEQTTKLKITVAKFIEVSFYQNGEITYAIALNKNNFKIVVDQNGHAVLTGKYKNLVFNASEITRELGTKFKQVTILFTVLPNGKVHYKASYTIATLNISVHGNIDIEKLILECSGLLCKTARAMKSRTSTLNQKILEASL